MRTRAWSTLAGAGLAALAAVLVAGCGDSGSAKGSPAPAKEKAPAKSAEPEYTPAKESPPVKSLEPIAPAPEPEKPKETLPKDPLPPPAPPPAPVEDKTTFKPATEKSLETTSYKCDACSKVATVAKTELAPTCCGSAMKPQP